MDDSRRKLGATSKFSKGVTEARVESAVPESSPFPTGTLGIRKKIDRDKSCPRRVFAEGHYDHSSNIISVVVKPVNTKLDREQLNLKVGLLLPFLVYVRFLLARISITKDLS